MSRVKARNLLRSLKGSYLRAAIRSTKTTPTDVLEVALCETPLGLAAIEAVRLTAYRLKCQGEWRDTELSHTKLGFLWKYPFTLNQERILKKYLLIKPFKIWIPTRQDWQKPAKIIHPSVDLWFTDGSGIHDCFGAGVYRPLYNYRESIFIGSLCTGFSARMMAILSCTELLLTKILIRQRIHICSDSRAALAALAETTNKSSLIWECMQVLGKLNELNKVTLV
jgi:hypothetical protein